MKQSHPAILCSCQVYHCVDTDKLEKVIAAFQANGNDLQVVDDLCYEAARHPESLQQAKVIIGCNKRTLSALCSYAGADEMPCVFDINKDVQKIIEHLGCDTENTDNQSTHEPVPEDWIAWYPVIDESRCIQCGKCADFCMFGVYSFENKTIKVINPAGCKTDCPACARMCPSNAIIFPKSKESNINGSLDHVVKPGPEQDESLRARLKSRRAASRLFKEDES
jgi:NAD-dependent dihydropyrimidine dehydrogenase PreA subunit